MIGNSISWMWWLLLDGRRSFSVERRLIRSKFESKLIWHWGPKSCSCCVRFNISSHPSVDELGLSCAKISCSWEYLNLGCSLLKQIAHRFQPLLSLTSKSQVFFVRNNISSHEEGWTVTVVLFSCVTSVVSLSDIIEDRMVTILESKWYFTVSKRNFDNIDFDKVRLIGGKV